MVTVKDLALVGIIILIAGITMGVGQQILQTISTTVTTATVSNESINFVANATTYQIGNQPVVSVSRIWYNSSHCCYFRTVLTPVPIDANGTYYYNTSGITLYANSSVNTIFPATCSESNICTNVTAGVHYVDYEHRNTEQYLATQNSSKGIAKVAEWIPTLGIVVAAGIVLGVVFGIFQRRKED
jgi:hypothetical protein